jgi:hypothetical protein
VGEPDAFSGTCVLGSGRRQITEREAIRSRPATLSAKSERPHNSVSRACVPAPIVRFGARGVAGQGRLRPRLESVFGAGAHSRIIIGEVGAHWLEPAWCRAARIGRRVAAGKRHRTWTGVITVEGYSPMAATWSDRDSHDDQIMQAAHDALRLMRAIGADVGHIDLFRETEESGNQHVEHRTVSLDQGGIVVSQNLTPG